jgi:chemotaxis protein MotA
VIGLIEVLQSLEDPTKIGPAMSLALMTTAFGSILGSLVFTPLAGRLEHHNIVYVETHKLLMNRVSILLKREDRRLDSMVMNKKLGADV